MALSRDPDGRSPPALELARDLERFVSKAAEPCVAEDVAQAMRSLFADRMGWRDALLAREPTTQIVEVVEIASDSPLVTPLPLVTPRRAPPPHPRPRRRAAILLAAIVALGALGSLVWVAIAITPAAPEITVTPLPRPAPRAPPAAPVDPPPSPAPITIAAPTVAPPAAPAPPRAPVRPRRARASEVSTPLADVLGSGDLQLTASIPMEVRRGRASLGRTPLHRRMAVGTHRLELVDPESGDVRPLEVRIEPGATTVMHVSAR
jgi:hypothetical protein